MYVRRLNNFQHSMLSPSFDFPFSEFFRFFHFFLIQNCIIEIINVQKMNKKYLVVHRNAIGEQLLL